MKLQTDYVRGAVLCYLADLPGTSDATNWEDVYAYDPNCTAATAGMAHAEWAKVYGGEFCFWGEHTSESNLETVAWPRGAAALEVLWSPLSFTNASSSGRPGCTGCDGVSFDSRWSTGAASGGRATPAAEATATTNSAATAGGCEDCHMVDRMREHGCRLKRRGLRPAPGNWGYCGGPGEEFYEGGHYAR